jgi:hypothetical protein
MAAINIPQINWNTSYGSSSTTQLYTTAGITNSTDSYITVAVPPGTSQINVPLVQQMAVYSTPVILRCDHSQYNKVSRICDGCGQTAKDIYQRSTPPMAFNKYINASDLLEEFIQYLGEEKIKKSEILGLPVDLFIKWLIIRACEQDKEESPVILQLPAPKSQPRCLGCQKYMKEQPLLIHGEICLNFYQERMNKNIRRHNNVRSPLSFI